MNKKALATILCTVSILCTAFLVYTVNNQKQASTIKTNNVANPIITNIEQPPTITPVKGTGINALYLDTCTSLEELKKNAEMIVIGKAVRQEDIGPASTVSTFNVSKVYKGKKMPQIEVLQLRDGSELALNTEYILFLGKQTDDSGKFNIKGGNQGIFLSINGKLSNSDEVMTKEIKKLEANENKQTDKLVDFIVKD